MSTKKIALVTGGSRGLGKDMALSLAKKGLDVVITYNSNSEAANETINEIKSQKGSAIALQLDTRSVSGFENFKKGLQQVLETELSTGKIDFLINNAGFGHNGSVAETTEQAFDDLMNVHLKGVYFLTQTLLDMINDGGGIVNISSGLTRFSFPGYSAYASIKGAIEVYSQYLAKELGERKIKANTVAPGAINTEFHNDRFEQAPQLIEMIEGMTALGRMGESDDIGGVVAFLCSEDAKWVNGQRIEVSGGMLI
ncbi:SDR family NAD(P)-dependent oxidoreductase [Croceitalea rosinachiae]|uniref:SDR family oxidoreductase n=1 Tax=Croceitalea rosinachiae TaxID=3075596 RepID=A0ABU3AAF6_9FLAO|nr:SDR family oxidoreductase [Croceitalea sp. F388]MDT0607167.1 SDR family oxidoreductase [Croceitalea sp. F388]